MGSKSKTLAMLLITIFLASLSLASHITVKSQTRTIVVPDSYHTLEDAVKNANSGDTIFVKKGTYYVDFAGLIIDKPLSMIGEDSQSTFIINSFNYYPSNAFVINVQANDVKISVLQ